MKQIGNVVMKNIANFNVVIATKKIAYTVRHTDVFQRLTEV